MRVWVTRARPGADATATRLAERGHAPLVAPLLHVEPIGTAPLTLEGIGALAFTSANAVRAFTTRQGDGRALRVYAVGSATAAAAREAGFADVRSSDGDVATLARAVSADPPGGVLLHPCAQTPAGDLAGDLAATGVAVRAEPIYRTVAGAALPEAVDRALGEGELDAVLIHSPRAAEALARLAGGRLAALTAFVLSPACLGPLADTPLAGRKAAPKPAEDALLGLLA